MLIPWSDIASVSSTVHEDPFDGSQREQLVVSVIDTKEIPHDVSGATWFGSDLHIDAHDWNRSVTDIALAAQGARDYATRGPAAPAADEPAMMWETSVDVSGEGTPESQDGDDDA